VDGQRILSGRYALVSHLARGGMADVWVGHDRLLDRRVAVKILHAEYAANEAFVARFRREAQAAANLNHPNIVDIYDWGRDGGVYFMVMELIHGRNLREVLRAEGALEPRRVAEIAVAVSAALGAAHERGLVHRDIKPANVLLTPDGDVKVTDFGIARAWDDSDQLTRTGAVIGTATYFSPEQAQGLTADGRSDLYALGVVMYELLTGVPPFVGESPVSVAYQHVREFAPPPSDLNPNIPDALDAIVMRCLEKDPRKRYQTGGALAVDLGRFLAGEAPTTPPPDDAPTRLTAPVGAPPLPPSASWDTRTGPAYPEPGRTDRSTLVIGILAALALLGLGLVLLLRLLLPSGAQGSVTIPDLRGQTRAAAVAQLEGLGLLVGDDQPIPDPTVAAGLVAGTNPAADEEVEEGATVRLLISTGPGDATVPSLVGETEAQARDLLREAGLTPSITYEVSQVIPAGTVISQNPAAGQVVPAATVVEVVVSTGSNALVVPEVVEHRESDALARLAEAGFTAAQIRIEREPSADVLEGFVIEVDPPEGSSLPTDGIVTLTISEGAIDTLVPNVVGDTPEAARAALEESGFVVIFGEPVPLDFGDENDGKVAEQSPEGGDTAEYGSTVTLRVGESAETVQVPDVLGDTPAAARATIEAAGLAYVEGSPIFLEAGDPFIGKVTEVSPPIGTEVAPGDTITVRLGAQGVRVPDVVSSCLSPGDARSAIQAAGLVYQEIGVDDTLPAGDPCDGRVVEQIPGPYSVTGALVAAGSTVQVRIGQALVPVPDIRAWKLTAPQDTAANSTALLTALGFTVRQEECRPTDDAYLIYVGKVVDQDPLGSPPGTAGLPAGSEVVIYLGVSTGTACPHPPLP
jgi:beta-lactam-binding protein with PASTA domain/predicted Ser/Thr protein kinase